MSCCKALLWVWQLPQNIIGLIWEKFDLPLFGSAGVCLGEYIILRNPVHLVVMKHEMGHQKQSRMLGPLYFLIIGLPSLIGNILHRFVRFNYYKQPWEAWADKLGGVDRWAPKL